MINMEERINRKDFRKTTNLWYFLKDGEVMTIGEVFYHGCKFLINDKIAKEVLEKIVLPSESAKMKENKLIDILNRIDEQDIEKLKIYMAYNLISNKYRNIKMSYHAMIKIITRFIKRDITLIREKLNNAIGVYVKKGKNMVLIWNTIFIIKDNILVTCYYPSKVTEKCIKYAIESGLDTDPKIFKTLDKIKKIKIHDKEEEAIC